MKTRRLGKTELKVSEVVLGGGWVGGFFINSDFEIMEKAFKKSLDSGINMIDTAETYSCGKSEKNIGILLNKIKHNKIYVSSKAKLDHNNKETIISQLDRKLDQSLKRLDKSSIELYQLHNRIEIIEKSDTFTAKQILKKDGVLDSLEKLKSEGRIKNIGITAIGNINQIKTVLSSEGFDTAQVYYNLLNPSASFKNRNNWNDHDFSGLIDDCLKYDIGIICIRIFAAGILATDIRHGREIPITVGISEVEQERRVKKIINLTKDQIGTRAQIALRYGLSNKSISCIVVGFEKLDHLNEIIEAKNEGPLEEDFIEEINKLHSSNFN